MKASGCLQFILIEILYLLFMKVSLESTKKLRIMDLVYFKSVTLHTDVGDIKVELFCEACPKTCENFLALCASDYYRGCTFHRNIKGFIVQTGDPTQTGKGGNSVYGKKFEDEFREELKHTARGMVSMANNGPNTNGSQFFITYGPQPHLDLKYTLFGKVIDGFDALDELEKLAVNPKNYRVNRLKVTGTTVWQKKSARRGGNPDGSPGSPSEVARGQPKFTFLHR